MARSLYYRLVRLAQSCPPYALMAVLLWALLVLPGAFYNELFPLDLGGIVQIPLRPDRFHWILSPYNGSGRYFPVYWLYHVLLWTISPANLKVYYLVQSALFLAAALLTGAMFSRLTTGRLAGAMFVVALVLSSPNAETLYTLGKTEPLVYFFLAIPLWLFCSQAASGNLVRPARGAAIAVLFALAIWCKETSISLFTFAVVGAAAGWALQRRTAMAKAGGAIFAAYLRLLGYLTAGFAISRLPYLVFLKERATDTAFYTTYPITLGLIRDNAEFYLFQQPDVVGFGVAATVLLLWAAKRVVADRESGVDASHLTFVTAAVAMAWSYLAIFLIWRWPLGYYLFLPSILFRFGAFYGMWAAARLGMLRRAGLVLARVCLAGLLAYASFYLWYIGSSQVAYSKVYTSALRRYVALSPDGGGLIFESYPFFAEQISATEQLFRLAWHIRRNVYGIADWINPAVLDRQMLEMLRVSDEQLRANESVFPKQGDFVLAMTGDKLGWDLRGVSPYYSSGSDLNEEGAYVMKVVAQERDYDTSIFRDLWTRLPAARPSYVGYKLYRVVEGPRFRWVGRYPDGWTGPKAQLTLYPRYCSRAVVRLSASSYAPVNVVRVFRNGVLLDTVTVTQGRESTLELMGGDAPAVFRFEVQHTFVPKKVHLNADPRELGVFAHCEVFGAQSVAREAAAGSASGF